MKEYYIQFYQIYLTYYTNIDGDNPTNIKYTNNIILPITITAAICSTVIHIIAHKRKRNKKDLLSPYLSLNKKLKYKRIKGISIK